MGYLLASLALVAAMLTAYVTVSGSDAVAKRDGDYRIAPQSGTRNVWVVNSATGKLRLCHPPRTVNSGPVCGKWSR